MTVLLALGLVTMTAPAGSALGPDGEVVERVEDERGRLLEETRTVPGEPGLRVTEVRSYPADVEPQPSDHGSGSLPVLGDPGTDCDSNAHDPYGFRWAEPYEAYANAHIDLLADAGQTWNEATAVDVFGGITEGDRGEAFVHDEVNQIRFEDFGDTDWLGRAYFWYYTAPAQGTPLVAIESDQGYNTRYALSAQPSPSQYDLRGLATHEMGHTLGLGHAHGSSASCLTMYPFLDEGRTHERTLGDGDIVGIQSLYGTPAGG